MNPLSLVTTPIELRKNGKPISYGTGFYYQYKWGNTNCIFLVTNYHVLTGNEINRRNLNPKGESIVFYYHMDNNDPGLVTAVVIPLFTKEGDQTWIEHQNKVVDIAIIPIMFSLPVKPKWKVIDNSLIETNIEIDPSDNVTLVGYPRMFLDKKNALPIYKTGNVASEYSYDFNGDPCFIIDISAFEGNSGSPVFSIQKNAQIISKSIIIKAPGSTIKFLGIYSASIIDPNFFLPITQVRNKQGVVTNLDLQLGVVWRANLINEIIDEASRLQHEKIMSKLIKEKGFKFKITKGLILN
jgi:hypothetical protein